MAAEETKSTTPNSKETLQAGTHVSPDRVVEPAGATEAASPSADALPPRRIYEDFTRRLLGELAREGAIGIETFDDLEDEDQPVLATMLLEDAYRQRATDVHIDPQSGGYRIRMRVDGYLYDAALLTRNQGRRLVNQFKTWANLDPVATFNPEEARWSCEINGKTINLRLTCVPCITGEKLSIRLLDPRQVDHRLEELGLEDDDEAQMKNWLDDMDGMFVVAGPTGSGKTSTLYAILHELKLRDRCIVTIEDPIEYQIDGISQIQVDRERGLTFSRGLRTMLRLDPDYLMVGEIRDAESARAAVDAAGGGRVVLTTLHAPDTVGSITALRNWTLKNHEIAVNLKLVVSQRLVRRLCHECKRQSSVASTDRAWLESVGGEVPEVVYEAVGCDACDGTGYLGRTGVFEVWRLEEADYHAILSGADEHKMRNARRQRGVRTLIAAATEKLSSGITSMAEIKRLRNLKQAWPTAHVGRPPASNG